MATVGSRPRLGLDCDKAPLARSLGLVAFVEDLGSTAEQMTRVGIDSYLVSRLGNRTHASQPGLVRAHWPALLRLLLDRAARCVGETATAEGLYSRPAPRRGLAATPGRARSRSI